MGTLYMQGFGIESFVMQTKKLTSFSKLQSTTALVFISIVGIAMSIIAYFYLTKLEKKLLQSEFEKDANTFIASLEREIAIDLAELESTWGLYVASDFVSRDEFNLFTTPIVEKHKSIQALEWVPRIRHKDRSEYVNKAREDGFSSFEIKELDDQQQLVTAEKRETYYPIYYVEPFAGNEYALGYDLASDPVRNATIQQSAETGEMLATKAVKLVQETKGATAILVFKPFYPQKDNTAVEISVDTLLGFVLGVYRVDQLFEQALNYYPLNNIEALFLDVSAPKGDKIIYSYNMNNETGVSETEITEGISPENELTYTYNIKVANQAFKLWFKPAPGYLANIRNYIPLMVLAIGLIFTLLVSAYMRFLMSREEHIKQVVQRRTIELSDEIIERKLVEVQLEESATELKGKNEELENDLVLARELQQAFVLTDFPSYPEGVALNESQVRYGRIYIPSGAVGGDYMDIRRLSEHKIGVFMGDVSGHGLRAALVVSSLRGLFEQLSDIADNPGDFITKLNKSFSSIFQLNERFMFVSCFYCVLDFENKEISFTNAGHPSPFIMHSNKSEVDDLTGDQDIHGPAVGLTPNNVYKTGKLPMQDGDVIFLYTDGIYEAHNENGEEYEFERLKDSLKRHAELPPHDILVAMLNDVKAFSHRSEFEDDVCMLALGFNIEKSLVPA